MSNTKTTLALLPDQSTIYSTDILEAVTSKGGLKFWQGHVSTDGKDYYTYTTYCQSTCKNPQESLEKIDYDWYKAEGNLVSKITVSAPTLIEGKNIGRSNETTPKDQAVFEIDSTFKKQLDKGYYTLGNSSERDNKYVLPMLAYSFADKAHTVTFPLTLQPKYDGVRCLSDGKDMWSRKGKQFDPKIVSHLCSNGQSAPKTKQLSLEDLLDNFNEGSKDVLSGLNNIGYITDGELILPAPYTLQDTLSAAKKYYQDMSPKLLYRIYDIVAPDLDYPARYEIVKKIVAASNHPQIILAPVSVVNNEDEMHPVHEEFVKEGWEGTMIRVHGHGYKAGQRHQQLLKLKDFLEEEFKVVGVVEGKGKFKGAAIFVCENKNGLTFNCTPVGSMEQRQKYFEHPEQVINTWWTIRFQAYTKDDIPQFGRAINERDKDIQG